MKMEKIVLILLLVIQLYYSSNAIRYEITAPNIFRLGVPETVGISISDHAQPIEVEIFLQDSPGKTELLSFQRLTVHPGTPEIIQLTFKPSDIPELYKDDEVIFAYLSVRATKDEFPPKDILIPVKKYAGYAFLQTDKPLYLPDDTVHIRVLHLNEKLLPTPEPFALEIKNPNGYRVLYKEMIPDAKGITETQYKFPELPLLGNWSVSIHYGYQMTGRKTVHCEVEKYVLPTFSVKIEPPKYILNTDQSILIKVSANYVYGKPVQGFLNVNYTIRNEEGVVFPLGTSYNNELELGEFFLSIDVEKDIKQRGIVWFPHVLGSNLLIEAEVMEKATGVREKADDYSSVFTMSPYTIEFSRSIGDFKPSRPYQLHVNVKLSNGQGAPDVRVQILRAVAKKNGVDYRVIPIPAALKTDKLGRVMFQFDTSTTDQQLEIVVGTRQSTISDENQATNVITVESFKLPDDSSSFVSIAIPGKETIFKVDNTFETFVTIFPPDENIILHYIVVARGAILLMDETKPQGGVVLRSIQFPISPEMSPSVRLIVYIVRNDRIIADSLKIEVEEKCKYNDGKELEIEAYTSSGLFRPDQSITLRIKGEVDSSVGILAVDKAVYVLNEEYLLTREQLFHELTAQDFGCGPGGGVNTEKVFQNAGVVVLTNVQLDNHNRQECQVKNVVKRSIGPKVSDYSGTAAVCCRLGQLEGPPDMNCTERAEIIYEAIGDAENCSQAFFDCCETIAEYTENYNERVRTVLGESNANNANMGDLNILEMKAKSIRSIFPETWLWKTYTIGGPECTGVDKSICEIKVSIPHSITTWSIQAVGVSQKTGICVAKPNEVVVFRAMFIQMQLPYAAIRGEQILLPVTIFNYDSEEIEVDVFISGVEGVCTGAGAGEKSKTQKITVAGNSASTVTFPIMPLKVSEFPIKVVAISWSERDAIEKKLKVVYEGTPTVSPFIVNLDPSGFRRNTRKRSFPAVDIEESFDAQQNRHSWSIGLELPDKAIPETGYYKITLMGDVVGQVVTTSIQGLDKRFFHLPRGCGEQTMITLAPLVYTMIYLRRTDKLNAEFERTGYTLMQQGYSHILQYRKTDGSFSVWTYSPSSVWLTAFVAKVLCQAESFIQIPKDVRCKAIEYIVQNQKLNGAFDSTNNVVHHPEMTGGIQGDVTTTAFVLISMMSCDKCNDIVDTKNARTKAVTYLEEHLDVLNQPYALAVVTYALALAQSDFAAEANTKLRDLEIFDDATDSRFWNWNPLEFNEAKKPWVFLNRPDALAVETTAYALLAQLHFDDIMYSHPIANWLNRQRNDQGSFVSTQDTVMALEALAEYASLANLPTLRMQCNISSEGSIRVKRSFVLNKANSLNVQESETFKIPIGGKIFIDAVGVGVAAAQVTMYYNVVEDKTKKCAFNLEIKSREKNETILPAKPRQEFGKNFNKLPENVVKNIISKNEIKNRFSYNDVDEGNDEDRNRANVQNPAGQSRHVVQLQICVQYLDVRPAGMSILEIGLFTGYKPVEEDLVTLTNNPLLPVTQYQLSDRSIILYLDYVPHDQHICIKLKTYQVVSVGEVQPAAIKIYDYYEPSKSCTKFYKPDGSSPMIKPICEEGECICLEGQCRECSPFDKLKKIKFDTERRTELMRMACNDHDFVWKGELKDIHEEDGVLRYDYLITDVLKEGSENTKTIKNKRKLFTSRPICKCPEMEIGKTYYIMGKDGSSFITSDGEKGYTYLFDKGISVYQSRPLRDIKKPEESNLQKTFNWMLKKMVNTGSKCD